MFTKVLIFLLVNLVYVNMKWVISLFCDTQYEALATPNYSRVKHNVVI